MAIKVTHQTKSIEVVEVDTTVVYINDKEVRKDMNNNWVASEELTTAERKAFRKHLKRIGE